MKLSQMVYMPIWYLKNVICKGHNPIQTVLFITDHCNLRCKHCYDMGHSGTIMKTYEQIKEELEYSYKLGSRIVDFEGGEPTLWSEYDEETGKNRDLNDLILLAKSIGYFSCSITTNAQKDFSRFMADCIWVSLDGNAEYHDEIRGQGAFERLEKNVKAYVNAHPKAYVATNMTVNRLNMGCVEEVLNYVKDASYIAGAAINFHTPFPGTEELMLSDTERKQVIDKVIELKKKNPKIINSVSGLNKMGEHGFKKYCWISNFIVPDGRRLKTCPGEVFGICDKCGFCMAGEEACVARLKPDTILAGLKLRL